MPILKEPIILIQQFIRDKMSDISKYQINVTVTPKIILP